MNEIPWPRSREQATYDAMTRVIAVGAWRTLCQIRDEPKPDGVPTGEKILAYEMICRDLAMVEVLKLISALGLGVEDEAAGEIWSAFESDDLGPALWATLEGLGLDPAELDPTRTQ